MPGSTCIKQRLGWLFGIAIYLLSCFLFLCVTGCELKPKGSLEWAAEREIRIEAIQRVILQQLGLEKPPEVILNVTRSEEEQVYSFYLQRKIFEKENEKNSKKKTRKQLLFDLNACRHKVEVKRAELKLFFGPSHSKGSETVQRITIYQVLNPRESKRLMVASELIRLQEAGQPGIFNIKKAVKHWLAHPQDNYGLELEFSHDMINRNQEACVGAELKVEGYQFLQKRRTQRDSPSEDCHKNVKQCCRKSMQVSFEEIGWADWIKVPKVYDAFYCDGTCLPKYKNANAYTEIKSKMHDLSHGHIPGPCCVPADYVPLTVIHFNTEGKLTISALDGMIASKCHCS
ncbi:bone morphogenetic protein 5-like [Polyodon spathula]|uniref:bone morphogenetic protein 5-like n=1 Tax=Polyodon spathula TaxID=7913 RepID=UPI001B7DD1D9|nr:bone morphogenetic protein 5-like [Polyodon spathula]